MKNTILSVVLSTIMAASGMQTIKAQTKEELCELTKKSMIEGWEYLDNYNSGFKPALQQLGFSTTEKDAIFTNMCEETDEKYIAIDQTVYAIMQDNELNKQEKKFLIQRLILGQSWLGLPAHLNGKRSKYHAQFIERVKRAYNPDNRAKVIAYLEKEKRMLKKENEILDGLLNK